MTRNTLQRIGVWVTIMQGLVCAGVTEVAGEEADLAAIVGPNAKDWKLTHAQDADIFSRAHGQIGIVSAAGRSVELHGQINYPANTEHRLKLRFLSPKGGSGSAELTLGRKSPEDDGEKLLSLSLAVDDESNIACRFHNPLIARSANATIQTTYALQGLETRQTNWPEGFRLRVDELYADLTSVTEKWFTLRVVTLKDRVRAFVDDRLFGEWLVDEEVVQGKIDVALSDEVFLASLRTRTVDTSSLYVPVRLDHYINASKLNGSTVSGDSLGALGKTVHVGGVPFMFATPDARGNDHIDVGKSWVKYGTLVGGYLTTNRGVFGGRWRSALTVNPSRIQLALPKEAHSRLHVLAVADTDPDSVPEFTAQFYLPASGFPINAGANVPMFNAEAADATSLPIELSDGRKGALYLVTIELDVDRIAELCQLESLCRATRDTDGRTMLGLELTKSVQPFRTYPDPISYSTHGAGLPSAVHVYAITLEKPRIDVDFQPGRLAHIWTAPEKPTYHATLTNHSQAPRTVSVELQTKSYDGHETTRWRKRVTIGVGAVARLPVELDLERYGSHDVILTVTDGDQTWTARRRLAHLHRDTRVRGGWEKGQGPLFGYWGYSEGHAGVPKEQETLIMAKAGCETMSFTTFGSCSAEVQAVGKQYGMKTFMAFDGFEKFSFSDFLADLRDGMDPVAADAKHLELLKTLKKPDHELDELTHISFFAEPQLGPVTHENLPYYYGEPERVLAKSEQKRVDLYSLTFRRGRTLALKQWPELKMMLPWGDPLFVVPFLRQDKELAELIDVQGIDEPFFERLPEAQIGQATGHRKWQLRQEWKKVGREPEYVFVEGNFVPAMPGAVTDAQQADYIVRNHLHLLAYSIYNLPAGITGVSSYNYYGEEHYGGGYSVGRLPHLLPRPAYSAYATLTRHLNRKNFVRYVPTGSETVFCVQFKHYESGELTHVLWTVRGRRPVTLSLPSGGDVAVYDQMDNRVATEIDRERITLTVTSSPQFVEGLSGAPEITLGRPDHSDASPGKYTKMLTNFGAGGWSLKAARDQAYENNHPFQVARFLGNMSATIVRAPAMQGGQALAIQLNEQDIERKIMPWYTTLVPDEPVVIPGKASHLGLWVKANSDWGRVIYSLRDAKGERWVSIGSHEQWNCDDIHGWSAFNFDGWRYLRFETPANAPYDSYRENGSTWWGHFDNGDGIVDLPLQLEKVIVERRTHVMHVNEPVKANPADVLLGDLIAEYADPADQADEVIRLSRLRMPVPVGVTESDNPIETMARQGVGAPTSITGIHLPLHGPDGTKCHVNFTLVEGAKHYDIWASRHADGRGAKLLGPHLTESGKMVSGFHPEVGTYLFVVYTDKEGRSAKPSAPFKIRLKDMFLQK